MRGPRGWRPRREAQQRFIPAHAGTTGRRCPRALARPVHPRACGDHTITLDAPATADGSSPRMRGPRTGHQRRARGRRFIPAHAGTTRTNTRPTRCTAVHPRACGDHLFSTDVVLAPTGSSPRMRGPHVGRRLGAGVRRFIPAHAGTTPRAPRSCGGGAVHPRACGDHAHALRRGMAGLRFIPAHAGTTFERYEVRADPEVHPRACGDHGTTFHPRASAIGSSPRMRGPPGRAAGVAVLQRFIPAHAGTTAPRVGVDGALARRFLPAHAGTTRGGAVLVLATSGSSPRMRGPHGPSAHHRARLRFIPAHAGTTWTHVVHTLPATVHPRACGDHQLPSMMVSSASGSSPRMRGPLEARGRFLHPPRFIPAHAGTTSSCVCVTGAPAVHPRACGDHCASAMRRSATASVHPRACGDHAGAPVLLCHGIGSSPRMRGPRAGWPAA